MPEINNALALGINSAPLDISKPLLAASQINSLRARTGLEEASTAQTQQETAHRQRLYDRLGGMNPQDINTLAEANQKRLQIGSQIIGNILANGQSPLDRKAAVDLARYYGSPASQEMENYILTAPKEELQRHGLNMQRIGMSTATATTPEEVPPGNTIRIPRGGFIGGGGGTNNPLPSNSPPPSPSIGKPLSTAIQRDDDLVRQGKQSPTPDQVRRGIGPATTPQPDPTSILRPRIIRDSSGAVTNSSNAATETLRTTALKQFEKSSENFNNSGQSLLRIGMMEHAFDALNSEGWSSTGSLTPTKMEAAKTINSVFTSLGMQPVIDPNKVSFWEDLRKETKQAGFQLARMLGSREAASVVDSTISAVPGETNAYLSAKRIMSGMKMAINRENDFYKFQQQYAATHHGDTYGADVEFNRQFPPELYAKVATANVIPKEAVTVLAGHPTKERKATFDSHYGAGMADFVLGAMNGGR